MRDELNGFKQVAPVVWARGPYRVYDCSSSKNHTTSYQLWVHTENRLISTHPSLEDACFAA